MYSNLRVVLLGYHIHTAKDTKNSRNVLAPWPKIMFGWIKINLWQVREKRFKSIFQLYIQIFIRFLSLSVSISSLTLLLFRFSAECKLNQTLTIQARNFVQFWVFSWNSQMARAGEKPPENFYCIFLGLARNCDADLY